MQQQKYSTGGGFLCDVSWCVLTPLEPQSRFGGKPLKLQVVCPQNGTAVLKGLSLNRLCVFVNVAINSPVRRFFFSPTGWLHERKKIARIGHRGIGRPVVFQTRLDTYRNGAIYLCQVG